MIDKERITYEYLYGRRGLYAKERRKKENDSFEEIKRMLDERKDELNIADINLDSYGYQQKLQVHFNNGSKLFIKYFVSSFCPVFSVSSYEVKMVVEFDTYQTSIIFNTEDAFATVVAVSKDLQDNWTELVNAPLEYEKKLKLKDIAENSINLILEQDFAELCISWNLSNDCEDSSLLEVKLSNNRILEIQINRSSFISEIQQIKKYVIGLVKLEKETGINGIINNYGTDKEWKHVCK